MFVLATPKQRVPPGDSNCRRSFLTKCEVENRKGIDITVQQPPVSFMYTAREEFEQAVASTTVAAGATMSFFRYPEDYRPDKINGARGPDSITRSGQQTGPQTIGFDESPAGYSLASCSPAELASASPADRDSEPEVTV